MLTEIDLPQRTTVERLELGESQVRDKLADVGIIRVMLELKTCHKSQFNWRGLQSAYSRTSISTLLRCNLLIVPYNDHTILIGMRTFERVEKS